MSRVPLNIGSFTRVFLNEFIYLEPKQFENDLLN